MTLRFKQRHVHQSLIDYVKGGLVDLGWGDASLDPTDPANANVNFGTTPMTVMEVVPDENGQAIAPNTVAITLGDEPETMLEQLGGGLHSVSFALYVDVYGANQGVSLSMASDVKDLLFEKAINVNDYMASPPSPVDGSYIEFEAVRGPERPVGSQQAAAESFRRYWRLVQANAVAYFSEGP